MLAPYNIESHNGKHCCIVAEDSIHCCDERCPCCDYYCDKEYDHPGPHHEYIASKYLRDAGPSHGQQNL